MAAFADAFGEVERDRVGGPAFFAEGPAFIHLAGRPFATAPAAADQWSRPVRGGPPDRGARTRERLSEALGAQAISLTDVELQEIERAVPADAAAGSRYAEQQMAMLDSER